jgi:type II secretory pathway component GspD/PulD (secretin)
VILGGFINDEKRDSKSGVPWLKDLPLLGWAFRSSTKSSQRAELIVLIRPTILDTPQEAARVAELERRNLPNAAATAREFQQEEAQMAQDLGVIPGNTNAVPVDSGKKSKSSRRKKSQ